MGGSELQRADQQERNHEATLLLYQTSQETEGSRVEECLATGAAETLFTALCG